MKKLLTLFIVLALPLTASTAKTKNDVPRARITSFVSEYGSCEGVELLRVGRLGTSAVKTIIRLASKGDEDASQALELLKGVRRLMVMDYSAASPVLKRKMTGKLDKVLSGSEMLLEVKDGQDVLRMYGVADEDASRVRDFVLYNPSDYTLICVFGSISAKAINRIIEEND